MEFSFGGWHFEVSAFLIIFAALSILFIVRGMRKKRSQDGKAVSYDSLDDGLHVARDKNGVAIIDIRGPILTDTKGMSPFVRNFATSGEDVKSVLNKLAKRRGTKAVLLRFNTPGGTALGSESIFEGIQACRDAGKVVVAYVQDMSASGGVWAMVGASHIVAHKTALIGSIGVIGPRLMQYTNVTRFGTNDPFSIAEQVSAENIEAQRLHKGAGKALGDPFVEHDEGALESFSSALQALYDEFVRHVSSARGIAQDVLHKTGAAILCAQDARALGLIDKVGNEECAQEFIAEKIGIPWKKCRVSHISFSKMGKFSFMFSFLPFMFPHAEQAARQSIACHLSKQLHLAMNTLSIR